MKNIFLLLSVFQLSIVFNIFVYNFVDCSLPLASLNGNVAYGSDVTVVKYTCNAGYTLQGYSEAFCQDDGTGWNTSVPDCGKGQI
jgi:hypothetical protein